MESQAIYLQSESQKEEVKQEFYQSSKDLIEEVMGSDCIEEEKANNFAGFSHGSQISASSASTIHEIAFTRAIQEYKMAFDRRETPMSIRRLGWTIVLFLLLILASAAFKYQIKVRYTTKAAQMS